ncbi:MAG: hypothetical protein RIQ34_1487 [Bacteroidota bacterium]|jgi:2-C-methyl-D-erythritol 4-phosphate cytidylyltransferase
MDHSLRKKIAVVVAGGVGMRMGADRPKQFLALEGQSILNRTLETFLSSYLDLEVVLVLPDEHMDSGVQLVQGLPGSNRIRFVKGGETRFHSVQNGLATIDASSIIFVHDAVRCLLTIDLIHRCNDQALRQGSAIPAIVSKDSIRWLIDGKSKSIPRHQIRLIQTPQTFLSEVLLSAYQVKHHPDFTDEASVVEASGQPIYLINGEERNIKITHPDDLITAAQWLRADQ